MASQWPPKKNTAFTLYFTLYKNDGTVVANPGTYTLKVSKDGGAVATATNTVTEVDTTYGECSLVLTATEMNADAIWVYITDNTTGTVPFTCTLYTAANLMDDIKTDTAAIKTKTDYLPSATAGASGGVFIAGSNAATTVNITGNITGTLSTVTNLTNLPAITAGWLTASGIAASALNGKGDWNVGKTGYSLTPTTGLGNQTANITGNLSGSVGSVTGAVGSVTGNVTVGTNNDKTGYSLTATTGLGNQTANITGNLSGSVGSVTGHTPQTGDSYAIVNSGTYGNAVLKTTVDAIPTLAEMEASTVLALEATGQAIKAKTDSLTFTKAGEVDANLQSFNDISINGNGSTTKFGV